MNWPDGFIWGTGASSTQCEGASPASDWLRFERSGHAPPSGDGNGFADRHAEDFRLLAGLGLTHHRLSIDWARIEPAAGERDHAEVDRYRTMLGEACDAGIHPWVTLHHFTLPRWVADAGGFASPAMREGPWSDHVAFLAGALGDVVEGWKPINESNLYGLLGYELGVNPPGHNDPAEADLVQEQTLLADAEAAVRLRDTGRPVCSVLALSPIVAHDASAATARRVEEIDRWLWRPGVDLQREGVLRVRDRPPVERADLAGAFDLLGFSYYFTIGVADGRETLHPHEGPVSPLGYRIFPDGVGMVIDRLRDEVPERPLVVCEYGIGTDDDAQRADYLDRGLAATHAAIGRGADVRGFFHWTGVDNYEWALGHDVHFGIIDRDRNVKPSAEVLRREAVGADA